MVETTLLIDDSDIDLFIQRRFLEVYHFSKKLISFKSAEEALISLHNYNGDPSPDIIFLDLNMPNVDGFAFLEKFQSLPEGIRNQARIVVLTSSNSQKDRDQVFRYKNVIQFVTKPIKQSDIEDLKKIV